MLCANPTCPNTVPEGWEGGMCLACCYAIEDAEAEQRRQWEEEERQDYEPISPDEIDHPAEDYGFDYPWEL